MIVSKQASFAQPHPYQLPSCKWRIKYLRHQIIQTGHSATVRLLSVQIARFAKCRRVSGGWVTIQFTKSIPKIIQVITIVYLSSIFPEGSYPDPLFVFHSTLIVAQLLIPLNEKAVSKYTMQISTDEFTRVDNNKNNEVQYLTKIISNYSRPAARKQSTICVQYS